MSTYILALGILDGFDHVQRMTEKTVRPIEVGCINKSSCTMFVFRLTYLPPKILSVAKPILA